MPILGLLGGTFNPVHNGHLFLALEARALAGLSRVVLVPNRLPPHKEQPGVTAELRYEMLMKATKNVAELEVSRVELEREGRSYTIDTLLSFPPEQPLAFICGADAFETPWHRLVDVFERLDRLVLAHRAHSPRGLPEQLEALPQALKKKIFALPFPDIAISSSEIRLRARDGLPFRFLIPESVYRIITKSRIYRDNHNKKSQGAKPLGRDEHFGKS